MELLKYLKDLAQDNYGELLIRGDKENGWFIHYYKVENGSTVTYYRSYTQDLENALRELKEYMENCNK